MRNRTIMQMFEWYLNADGTHWKKLAADAKKLAADGVTMAWLPPAYKCAAGINDVGYGVYDTYDLGEFDQKGTVPTKYGTRKEYLKAVKDLQSAQIEVLADMVMNHRMGADELEQKEAVEENCSNRLQDISGVCTIGAWTRFTFPGRKGKYSEFIWDASCFDGVDWDDNAKKNGIFRFKDKSWEQEVDGENVNYDYLMGADLDLGAPQVIEELDRFGKWYIDTTGVDGFRLDAVKHMHAGFYRDWLGSMRAYSGKEMFTVGEYWSPDLGKLQNYIGQVNGEFSLFDVPLHFRFFEISHANGSFDMAHLLDGTLTAADSWHSVTFVDNHDTQPGQALQTFVADWFKPLAYGVILLQEKGVPCVFYGDYYGIPHDNISPVKELPLLMRLRQSHAHGLQRDYFDHCDVVGFTREGETAAEGLALLISDGSGGCKSMDMGAIHAGQTFKDALGNCPETVTLDENGRGTFRVEGGSVSVWIPG